MRAAVEERVLPLREPLRAAWGELRERRLLLLRLEDEDGVPGLGEASPLEPYDGVPLEAARAALEDAAAVLRRGGGRDEAMAAAGLRVAAGAVDMALWDLAGHREGTPVAALLAGDPLTEVPVNATVAAEDAGTAAAAAARARAAGFACLKLKVGVGDDARRVAAVRAAAGPETALRLDANGAWSVEEAERALAVLSPAGLELVEEPVHGLAALRELRERVPVRIAMDETAAEPGALASGAADAVCLKVGRGGGISDTLAAAALVRTTGAEVYLASAWDGPVGVAAAVHVAAALRVELPCGLATLGIFAGLDDPFPVRGGAIAVPTGPGLGV